MGTSSNAGGKDNSRKRNESAFFIIIGLLLILFSICLHSIHLFKTKIEFLVLLNELIAQTASHIGIGCMVIGIISYMLDFDHWTNYFEERLSKIVIKKEHLRKLNIQDLTSIQTEVLKVYFQNDDIGGAYGFLNYYQKNIQSILGKPFRTNTVMSLTIKEIENETERLEVFETMSYICKSNSKKIQERIIHVPEKDEYAEIKDFFISIQHESLRLDGGDETGKIEFDLTKLKTLGACNDFKIGFSFDITKYNFDGLSVMVNAHYTITKNRFIAWRMSHPTNNMTLSVNYPSTFKFSREFFFNENNNFSESNDSKSNTYILTVNDWLMPDEGITMQILK